MIRAIAAIDDRCGLSNDDGIPWHVPADVEHFRSAVAGHDVLMGRSTYEEFERPLPDCINYVATRRSSELRHGFVAVADPGSFLSQGVGADLWIIGGAGIYATTLPAVEELHLTRVEGDFGCTKFFPPFESDFSPVSDDPFPPADGTPGFRFQTWQRRAGPRGRAHRD